MKSAAGTPRRTGATVRRELAHVAGEVKPRLRGWLHAFTAPMALVAGVVLVAFTPGTAGKIAGALFCLSAVLMFTVSAIYHTRVWPEQTRLFLRRFDHANIFLLIAGSYSPFAVLLLPPDSARTLLIVVWTGALLGVSFRLLWLSAPRWLYVPIYIGLGWTAVFWAPDFAAGASVATLTLMVLGGALYTLGAVFYAAKRPNPAPAWFGFHEMFHTLTIAAFLTHYVGVWLIL